LKNLFISAKLFGSLNLRGVEAGGSSRQAVLKYIVQHYNVGNQRKQLLSLKRNVRNRLFKFFMTNTILFSFVNIFMLYSLYRVQLEARHWYAEKN